MEDWLSCGGTWEKSKLLQTMRNEKRLRHRGARIWLTKQQIVDKYGSKGIAESICNAKLDDPELKKTQTREHPDCPNDEARG